MKKFFCLTILLLTVTLLTGCGSTKFLVKAPNGDKLNQVNAEYASKKNVKLVLIQNQSNFLFNADQKKAITQLGILVGETNLFGTVTVDGETFYKATSEVANPSKDEFVLGMTLSSGYKPYFFQTLGKTLLNIATLTLSSAVLPYSLDISTDITLTLIGENGPIASYGAEAIGQARWTPWTFQSMANRNSQAAIRTNAMTDAVNQMVSAVPTLPRVSQL